MTRKQAILLAAILLPLALLLSAKYLIVDVHEAGPDGTRVFLPVPLALAQAATYFAPEEAIRVETPELARYHEVAQMLMHELETVDDVELVRVESGDEEVLISKIGEDLIVDVLTPKEEVEITFPVETLAEVLEAYDGEYFDINEVVRALRWASGGSIHLRNGDTEVKVKLW